MNPLRVIISFLKISAVIYVLGITGVLPTMLRHMAEHAATASREGFVGTKALNDALIGQ